MKGKRIDKRGFMKPANRFTWPQATASPGSNARVLPMVNGSPLFFLASCVRTPGAGSVVDRGKGDSSGRGQRLLPRREFDRVRERNHPWIDAGRSGQSGA